VRAEFNSRREPGESFKAANSSAPQIDVACTAVLQQQAAATEANRRQTALTRDAVTAATIGRLDSNDSIEVFPPAAARHPLRSRDVRSRLLAAVLPAVRGATSVDPAVALRAG
jgi:hypothetical protein